MRRVGISFGILALVLAGAFVLLRFWALRPDWRTITDPAKLRHEATLLCQGGYPGHVPREAWPEGIAALKPLAVFVASRESVTVIISARGISALSHGYIIWSDTVQRTDGGITKFDEARDGH